MAARPDVGRALSGDTADDDDPVVEEMDVYLTQDLADKLYVMQFPLRPAWKPYDMSLVQALRHRPTQKLLEIDLDANSLPGMRNAAADYENETHTLSSVLVPAQTNHCIGVLADGALHLTPLHATLQMRPSLAYIDNIEAEKKRREQMKEKEKEKEKGARGAASAPRGREEGQAEEEGNGEEGDQFQQALYARPESEKVIERKHRSYDSLVKAREREPWASLEYHAEASDESNMVFSQLLSSSKGTVPFLAAPPEYLRRLTGGLAHKGLHGYSMDVKGEGMHVEEHKKLSKEIIRQMKQGERIAAILKHTSVMPFFRLCELSGISNAKQALADVEAVGIVVQGNWAIRSEHLGLPERLGWAYDRLLLHFKETRTIKTLEFVKMSKLHSSQAKELIERLALPSPGYGHEFRYPFDATMESDYPEVVQRQAEEWARITARVEAPPPEPKADGASTPAPVSGGSRGRGRGRGASRARGASVAGSRAQPVTKQAKHS